MYVKSFHLIFDVAIPSTYSLPYVWYMRVLKTESTEAEWIVEDKEPK